MKTFIALCLFGVFAAALAMPQDRPQVSDPTFIRPPRPMAFANHETLLKLKSPLARFLRPDTHHPRPPMNGDRPTHPIAEELHPELHAFLADVRDFLNLYPRNEIRNLFRAKMQDPEFRATMKFFRTPEFQEIIHAISETPEAQAIGRYFATADWPWIQKTLLDAARTFETLPVTTMTRNASGGLSALLDEIIAILPKEQLRALFDEKMQNSAVFRSVVEIVSSNELKGLFDAARASPEIRTQFARLAAQGIDVEKMVSLKLAMVGF